MKIIKTLRIVIGVILILGIVSGWFYWFEWRPSQIKKECSKTYSYISLKLPGLSNKLTPDEKYQRCLHDKGL